MIWWTGFELDGTFVAHTRAIVHHQRTNGRMGIVRHAFTFKNRPADYERCLILLRAVHAYQCAVNAALVHDDALAASALALRHASTKVT